MPFLLVDFDCGILVKYVPMYNATMPVPSITEMFVATIY